MARPPRPTHRGTLCNPDGRFEPHRREVVDDGWQSGLPDADFPPPRHPTRVDTDASRSVIARNTSPDIGFDRSINPYRGCEHGCVYCFARPGHNYFGLSSGLDFETRLFAKPEAPRLLEAELRARRYRPAVIAIGTNTDPYQPVERRLRIMRGIVEVLLAFRHPLHITTKSALVTRDIDLLAPMAAEGLVSVSLSITTLDRELAGLLEPRASVPERRLAAISALAAAGIPTGVMVAPVIPALTDHEMERILEAAARSGAGSAGWTLIRLPHDVKDLFDAWLAEHRPERRAHVLSRILDARGGKLSESAFGKRIQGDGAASRLLAQRFSKACRRFGFGGPARLRADLFAPPPKAGDQMSLF